MLATFSILLFLFFTTIIFFISNLYLLLFMFLVVLMLLLLFIKSKKKLLKYFLVILPFVSLTVVFNLLLENMNMTIVVGLRLLIACFSTYLFSVLISPLSIAKGISNLFYPLKIVKVDINGLTMIIAIAISFIPILIEEAKNIKHALLAKGFPFTFSNIVKSPHLFIVTYFVNVFHKIDELELILKAKGYKTS